MRSKNSSPPLNLSSHHCNLLHSLDLSYLKRSFRLFFCSVLVNFFLLFFFRVVLRAREKGLGSNLQLASKALFTVNSNGS